MVKVHAWLLHDDGFGDEGARDGAVLQGPEQISSGEGKASRTNFAGWPSCRPRGFSRTSEGVRRCESERQSWIFSNINALYVSSCFDRRVVGRVNGTIKRVPSDICTARARNNTVHSTMVIQQPIESNPELEALDLQGRCRASIRSCRTMRAAHSRDFC